MPCLVAILAVYILQLSYSLVLWLSMLNGVKVYAAIYMLIVSESVAACINIIL